MRLIGLLAAEYRMHLFKIQSKEFVRVLQYTRTVRSIVAAAGGDHGGLPLDRDAIKQTSCSFKQFKIPQSIDNAGNWALV
jgi:hypothetical protein